MKRFWVIWSWFRVIRSWLIRGRFWVTIGSMYKHRFIYPFYWSGVMYGSWVMYGSGSMVGSRSGSGSRSFMRYFGSRGRIDMWIEMCAW